LAAPFINLVISIRKLYMITKPTINSTNNVCLHFANHQFLLPKRLRAFICRHLRCIIKQLVRFSLVEGGFFGSLKDCTTCSLRFSSEL
jgi:hypothetical protein